LPAHDVCPHAQGVASVGQHVAGSVVGSANVSDDVYELRTGPTSESPHPVEAASNTTAGSRTSRRIAAPFAQPRTRER